jgi:hypothetical protein
MEPIEKRAIVALNDFILENLSSTEVLVKLYSREKLSKTDVDYIKVIFYELFST